ncbi:MAG: sigma-70 family RNA polymerase sigma factor [Balneolaceae bacterium]|jgi:RNA polymerase sigma-70 factor (ECF subfamily)|nr:sigma-70 family RNA polymerase sigma factor [Balneolaceae bacterium]MDR9447106.1 sigma-70 family RNA polymerase sigma factor [Balneolaceae bacterium]
MALHSLHQSSDISRSSLSDNELVALYRKKHDHLAFNELFRRHQSKIYSYIFSMVQDEDQANDLFQETFSKVVQKMGDSYNEQGKWIAWVMRIAHNATIDFIRRHKRFVDVAGTGDEESSSDYFDRLSDPDQVAADDKMAQREDIDELFEHLASLPQEQRMVVVLRHFYDLSFKDIAEMTDVSINTALGRMRYALINLRKSLETSQESNPYQSTHSTDQEA